MPTSSDNQPSRQPTSKRSLVGTRDWRASARRVRERFAPHAHVGHFLVADTLRSLGCKHVFAVSGTPIHETIAACTQLGIRAIGTRHQTSAVLAAIAHSYVNGTLDAATIASAGPAITNLSTGILFAHDNCLPTLAIGGARNPEPGSPGVFQALNALDLFRSITKHASSVASASDIAPSLFSAAHAATSGQPGPAFLELQEGALQGRIAESPTHPPLKKTVAAPPEADLQRAAQILRQAERPLVIFGRGLRWNDAFKPLLALIEELHIPFIASPMGLGLVCGNHPFDFSAVSRQIQPEADAVLVAGARLDWQFRFGQELAPDARLVTIDNCAHEYGTRPRPEVEVVANAAQALERLHGIVREEHDQTSVPSARPHWIESLRQRRAAADRERHRILSSQGDRLSHERLMHEIDTFLPRNAISILDGNVSMLVAQEWITNRGLYGRFNAGSNGTVGVGVSLAIGAKLAQPDRAVVTVCGDFAFGLSAMELETAVRHRVPFIAIVVDNGGINAGAVQRMHYPEDHELVAGLGQNLRYDRLAESLGAHGESVASAREIRPALERAAASDLPAVLHVQIES